MVGKRASPFLRWYIDRDHEVPIDVFRAFRDEFIKELMENPEGVTLPARLGYIKIVGNKSPSEFSAYKTGVDEYYAKKNGRETSREKRKRGIVDYYQNFDTDGWVFKVEWFSRAIGKFEETMEKGFFNNEMYGWKSCEAVKRALCDKIKKGEWGHFHKKAFILSVRTKGKVGRPRNADRIAEMDEQVHTDNKEHED